MDSRQTRRALRAVLGGPDDEGRQFRHGEAADEEDNSPDDGDAFPQEELDAMLAEWEQRERSRVIDLLAAALGAAAIAGFIAAFKEWAERLGMELTPKPAMLDKLRAWAREQASKLFDRVRRLVRRGAEAIIGRGRRQGASRDTIRRRLRRFFRNSKATTEHAQGVARDEDKNAHNQGELDANQELGAKTKVWVTAGDGRVCPKCAENGMAGAIPVGQPFPSGHYYPEAHKRCRCDILYLGVTRGDVFDRIFSELRQTS